MENNSLVYDMVGSPDDILRISLPQGCLPIQHQYPELPSPLTLPENYSSDIFSVNSRRISLSAFDQDVTQREKRTYGEQGLRKRRRVDTQFQQGQVKHKRPVFLLKRREYDEGKSFNLPVQFEVGKGCRAWTCREEVFLVGCVFHVLFQTGSLVPTKTQRETKETCWDRIKYYFDQATARYAYLTASSTEGVTCQTRTKFAMHRHFKVMKSQVSLLELDNDEEPLFQKLNSTWIRDYNLNNRLTCSKKKFGCFVRRKS